ncbi:hypothetical protein ACPC54_26940 [Kitasatospora sp. NPDC094028]
MVQRWEPCTGWELARFDAKFLLPDNNPGVRIAPYPAPNKAAVIVLGDPDVRIVDITTGTVRTCRVGQCAPQGSHEFGRPPAATGSSYRFLDASGDGRTVIYAGLPGSGVSGIGPAGVAQRPVPHHRLPNLHRRRTSQFARTPTATTPVRRAREACGPLTGSWF